ncbi:hypothetical protein HIM_08886 [Hirsutella minnesotensis 3608]|uniref:MOSC domain-containing protein n=1 Tax=Hirsutella minnesotensis 3608 TaxID=1043627 RepID=A0A0F8A3F6_9HYPO|nr:hypothetical protein HIM_08886 [Hirsutella minnesotensis 3608]
MSYCTPDITKEIIIQLPSVSLPKPGTVLQIRSGKVSMLGSEPSGIFKIERPDPAFFGKTGIAGNEHVYCTHGGIDRAIMQYDSSHYADWRTENCRQPQLFQFGGFGENILSTNLTEENICIGDIYQLGGRVLVQVSKPRNPCYKLNLRLNGRAFLKEPRELVAWDGSCELFEPVMSDEVTLLSS